MRLYFWALFKEFLGNFCLGLGIFSLFFFFGESNKLLDLALISAGDRLGVFALTLGHLYGQYWITVSGFILPMALLLAATLTMSRAQEDREFIALESLGVALTLRLVVFMTALAAATTLVLNPLVHDRSPLARRHLSLFAHQGRDASRNLRIEPRTWLDLQSAQIFAQRVDGSRLRGVVLYSSPRSGGDLEAGAQGYPYKVTGASADYRIVEETDAVKTPDLALNLKIYDGSLEYPEIGKLGSVTHCSFATYENSIPLKSVGAPDPGLRELTSSDLLQSPERSAERNLELDSRWAIALSPLSLAFGAVLVILRAGHLRPHAGFGFGLALALLASYWTTLVLTTGMGRPVLANPLFAALCASLAWGMRSR